MANLRPKITIVFLPYVLVSATVILVMSLAKWLFEVKYGLLMFDTFRFDTGVSVILSLVLVIIVMRKRVHILDTRDKYGRPDHSVYYFLMPLFLVLPVNFAINYVGSACYSLKHVRTADEIMQQPRTRYYAIDTVKLLKNGLVSSFDRYTSSKGSTLNFSYYAAYPFAIAKDNDFMPKIWYVLHYSDEMSNSDGAVKKTLAYIRFINDCTKSVEAVPVSGLQPVYFDNLPDGRFRSGILQNVLHYSGYGESLILLSPVYKPFEERAGNNALYFFISWLAGLLVIFIIIIASPVKKNKLQQYYDNILIPNDEPQKAINFLNNRNYRALVLLAAIIVIILFVVLVKLLC